MGSTPVADRSHRGIGGRKERRFAHESEKPPRGRPNTLCVGSPLRVMPFDVTTAPISPTLREPLGRRPCLAVRSRPPAPASVPRFLLMFEGQDVHDALGRVMPVQGHIARVTELDHEFTQ